MLSDKKGIALLIVISFVLMFLVLGGAGLMISTGHFSSSFRQIKRARAYYAAEAGMQHALWNCRTGGYNLAAIPSGGSITPAPLTVSDPNYNLTADFEVYAEGEQGAPAGTHRIDIKVDY